MQPDIPPVCVSSRDLGNALKSIYPWGTYIQSTGWSYLELMTGDAVIGKTPCVVVLLNRDLPREVAITSSIDGFPVVTRVLAL